MEELKEKIQNATSLEELEALKVELKSMEDEKVEEKVEEVVEEVKEEPQEEVKEEVVEEKSNKTTKSYKNYKRK